MATFYAVNDLSASDYLSRNSAPAGPLQVVTTAAQLETPALSDPNAHLQLVEYSRDNTPIVSEAEAGEDYTSTAVDVPDIPEVAFDIDTVATEVLQGMKVLVDEIAGYCVLWGEEILVVEGGTISVS
jgi:hypothetical protein